MTWSLFWAVHAWIHPANSRSEALANRVMPRAVTSCSVLASTFTEQITSRQPQDYMYLSGVGVVAVLPVK
jgi:hypothetical protein